MRNLRNVLAHEYPDNPEIMVSNLNKVIEAGLSLGRYWKGLRLKIQDALRE